jgi:hypothetical protein
MTFALLVACVLVTGNCSPVTAQVAIGGDGTVTPGALLDLSQATDAGGLLLPQIVSADTATAVLKKPGMLVYNKTDGKIYAYNGTAWSAGGGGGGGSEPDPTPSPKTCGGSVMGVSGNLYPIGSYPYAQNDLKNLCWTLTNLLEAGASSTSYTGKDELRGYYYGAGVATNPDKDVCKQGLGSLWRIPLDAEWALLRDGTVDFTAQEKIPWYTGPAALAGRLYKYYNTSMSYYEVNGFQAWDATSYWLVYGDGKQYVTLNSAGTWGTVSDGSNQHWWWQTFGSIRCVRDL